MMEKAGSETEQIVAMNAAAAVQHAGLLLRAHGKWSLKTEEPFREPPYWLLES